MTEIRLLLVDDDALVRSGLHRILASEPGLEVVGEAGDGHQAVQQVAALAPDVVLMDVRMPGLDGIEATRRILASGPATRVLVVTTFEHDEYVYGALAAGASGFVLKRVRTDELVQAVRIVAAGESLVFPESTRGLVERFSQGPAPDDPRRALLARLTERESEILRLVARGASNAEIADELVVAIHTVKTHVARMLAKLEIRDRTQAVVFAYETGVVRPGD